ncbi:DUF4810 domain-containing protein [Pseudothauera rhizosphaerae]|uniref:DUF4810 domain-containing protein n=1 Tax=Pseudothauera rhizosphaerae TaxID=2565932 RepID=A0A4S4AMD0_9RHOO|nr:DUF4810 domain-containing protein [Pseudothauera rhizosphaerae]THF60202.1 DUF4810 domain-containing protein [Pseudothauera rhizosphaerae]
MGLLDSCPLRALSLAGVLMLSGCAATGPGPLYYWGGYQPQVYGHLTGEKGPDEQIAALEAGIEEARATGKPLPPGYQAHLGILYAEKEQGDRMAQYFEAEKAQYPEGAAYIDFLMRSKTR